MATTEYDWKSFDRIWDERGRKAAVLSLPLEPVVLGTSPAVEDDRCRKCGKLPQVKHLSPQRKRRSLKSWVKGEVPAMLINGEMLDRCECWVPEKLDYR